MSMEIISEEDIPVPEVKRIMEERKKDKDLVYEQKICLEYLEKIPKITPAKLKQLYEELSKIAILRPRYIAMIINILPDDEEEVDTLFNKERTNLKKEEIKKMVDIVNKYK